jgi:hypothetical protein
LLMSVYVWHDGNPSLHSFLSKLTIQHGTSIENLMNYKMIIRWCDGGDDSLLSNDKCWILNHSKYTKLLLEDHTIHSTLKLHKIPYEIQIAPVNSNKEHVVTPLLFNQHLQYYLIPVFQMDALGIFLIEQEDRSYSLKRSYREEAIWNVHEGHILREILQDEKTALLRRVERLAVRAVYAMGLDFACVLVQVQRSGSAVIRIHTNPIHNERLNDLFAHALNSFAEGWMSDELKTQPIVFGMDPEFLLRNMKGKIVPASRYLEAKGGVGYDSATVLGRKDVHPLAELRPEPSEDLHLLIKNLRRMMWMASTRISDQSLQWIAGGMPIPGLPLGGHLHVSGIGLNSRLVRALDNYLALPLIMIEDTSTSGRRKKYGRLGDVRRQSHGGFEYRTLPSWIFSPRVTKGVLALAKLITIHYQELLDRPLDHMKILEAYVQGNKTIVNDVVADLWSQMETTSVYSDYAHYLDPLKRWIVEQRIWNEQSDFRSAWRIPPYDG